MEKEKRKKGKKKLPTNFEVNSTTYVYIRVPKGTIITNGKRIHQVFLKVQTIPKVEFGQRDLSHPRPIHGSRTSCPLCGKKRNIR